MKVIIFIIVLIAMFTACFEVEVVERPVFNSREEWEEWAEKEFPIIPAVTYK